MITLEDILSSPQKYFSVKEVASAFGLTRQAVGYWIDDGKLKAENIGRSRVIKGSWVKKYIENHQK